MLLPRLMLVAGWSQVGPPRLPRLPRVSELPRREQDHIHDVYQRLGGDPEQFDRIRPGGWDLAFNHPDGLLLVELDEEQHFTRYRDQTLEGASRDLPWRATYRAYCRSYEDQLLPGWGTGKRWTNPSAERFFGDPSAPGDFEGVGAPRWRQRAFYDSVKDILPNRRLSRVSVHDRLPGGSTINTLLRRPDPAIARDLSALVLDRTHHS